MPYKKSGKRTSFGKQSDAEKSFRGRKKSTREEGSFEDQRGRPSRFSKPFRSDEDRPVRRSGAGGDFKKPFGKRPEGRGDFKRGASGFSKPFRKKGEGYSDEGGEKKAGFSRPFRKEGFSGEGRERKGSFSRPFRKEGFAGKGREDKGGSSRPFGKEGFSGERREKRGGFSKPFRSREGDEFKKPFGKSGNFGKPYKKEYKRREGNEREAFDQKSFIQKRVTRFKKSDAVKVVREKSADGLTRLNKYIANSGVCSRREADNLISMGLITVNGKSVTEMGFKVKPGDEVRYDGKLLKAEKQVYILLNKPKGFITTTEDPQERNTVMNLVAKACKERVYPVGRLDRNTTGLLLLTNDGELTEKLTHPSHGVKKIYKAELNKPLTKNDLQRISEGVDLEEGKARVDDIAIISDDGKTVGLEIHIGWNRVVRRIFEALGYEVVRLDRSVFAGLDKKDLGRGEWRFLKPEEVVTLKHFK